MKLSVVIPAFNEEDYIEPCLEALMRQSSDIFEVVVVDNGSTDATPDRVMEFAARWSAIRMVKERLPGVAAARNRGFAECSGDVIARIDADTRVEPGWATAILQLFRRKSEPYDAAVGPIEKYDAPLKIINRVGMAAITTLSTTGAEPATAGGVRTVNNLIGSNMAITVGAWQDIVDRVSLSRKKWDDVDVSILLCQAEKKIAFVPDMKVQVSGRRGRTSIKAYWQYTASLPHTLKLHNRHLESRASWLTVWLMRSIYIAAWVPNRAYDAEADRYSLSALRRTGEHRVHPGGDRCA